MSECTHDCSTCSSNCSSRQQPQSLLIPANPLSEVKHVIGVVSGKGGVGKSLVTSMLAVLLQREGYKVGVLDADITGPSIPKAFGVKDPVQGDEKGIYPPSSQGGIDIMSLNLMLEDEKSPVIWRGPVIAGTVKQFYTDVVWDNIDFLLIDCPPGTGDVPLTVFQSLPLDGIVIVTSPQQLVSMIVDKAVNMAKLMNVRILGIVENMSSFRCPDCGKVHNLFGDSGIEEFAKERNIPMLAKIPMDPELASLCDKGLIELMENSDFDAVADAIEKATDGEKAE